MIEMQKSGTKCMQSKIRKGFYKARRYAESQYAKGYSGSGSGISIDEGFDILNKYTSTDGYGSSIIKSTKSSSSFKPANSSSSNLKPVKQVSNNTISLSPEVILLIRECLKALNKISKNSDQMKTIVSLLTKIVTKNSKSDNNKNDKNKKSSKSSSSKDAQPIILNNKNDDNYCFG